MNMLWLVEYDVPSLWWFLGTLGVSSIMGCYLHIALVWLGGCLRWWFLCEDYVLWCAYDSMNICGWIDEGYICKLTLGNLKVIHCTKYSLRVAWGKELR